MKSQSLRRWAALLPVLLLPISFPVPGQETKVAVWKVREVSFTYSSSKAIYACSSLQMRVKNILLAVGAREDLQVRVNCDERIPEEDFEYWRNRERTWERAPRWKPEGAWEDPYERFERRGRKPEQNAFVRARLLMPIEVTPDVLAEIDRDKSRRELVSRLTGDPSAKLNDPILFSAQWQSVTLSQESIGLEPEECELLDRMSRTVFKDLNVRPVGRRARCRQDVSHSSPTLTVEALLAAPIGATSLPQIPASE
jgi:hypothetical protein